MIDILCVSPHLYSSLQSLYVFTPYSIFDFSPSCSSNWTFLRWVYHTHVHEMRSYTTDLEIHHDRDATFLVLPSNSTSLNKSTRHHLRSLGHGTFILVVWLSGDAQICEFAFVFRSILERTLSLSHQQMTSSADLSDSLSNVSTSFSFLLSWANYSSD